MKIARLIVDDRRIEREPRPDTIICKTAEEALAMLESGQLDDGIHELMLDHDLGVNAAGDKIDVRPFVDTLEAICGLGERDPIAIDVIYIHTSNPTGKKYIEQAFTNRHTAPHYPKVYPVSDTMLGLYDPNPVEDL